MSIEPNWFSLFKNNDNIEEGISEKFIEILKKCKHPHIVCIYGDARTGKSTKMNQIINGIQSENYFDLKGPFKTLREIHTAMTKGCNFYGPIKIADIANKNNIDINEIDRDIINDELFFVDTEGLKTIDNTTKSCISGILTILQIASIKILYIPFLDNEKLEDAVKNTKLSNILNLSINESQIIVLIRDIPLKEKKNERRINTELDHQKTEFENKINNYFQKIDGNISAICQILPSYELAANKVEPFPNCYISQMQDLVLLILTNITYNNDMNGQKLIEIIEEFLEIFKKVKNIEFMKNTDNALNLILSELFKEKINTIYLNLSDKIDKFEKEIISLNGKPESIKNYLVESIKKELKNTWEIYDKTIHNEINKQLEILLLKLEGDIRSAFDKEKDKITNETFSITNIENNKEIMNYLSQIEYKEEVDQNKIKVILEKIINNFENKYKLFFDCVESNDKDYKKKLMEYIKTNINNNLKDKIEKKPNWENSLRKLIFDIQSEISNPYKNDLKKKSKEEIQMHLNNNLDYLKKTIQIYIAKKGIKIYKIDELIKEQNYIFETIKEELSNQIKIIEGKIKEIELKKQKLYSKSIVDGIYLIYPQHCKGKVFDISGGSKDNNAILQLFDFNDSNAQKFQITYNTSKRYYTLKCLCSDKYITFNQQDNNIVQFAENNNANQQWHIVSIENNYEIISELNGKLMDVSGNEEKNGTKIVIKERTGGLNQQFKFIFTQKTLPPPPPQPQPPIPFQQTQAQVSYFPPPNFSNPKWNPLSIVDALKSINENPSLSHRSIIGQKNGIPGKVGTADYNIRMLSLLKSGRLIRP